MPDLPSIDPRWFRDVLGQYPTGVAVVTATADGGGPVGMVVGSFTSVSLAPPIVAFFPANGSTTWPQIESAGAFCVNILAAEDEVTCRAFATSVADKFTGVAWRTAVTGAPVLASAVAWIDCTIDRVDSVGDHFAVYGAVQALDIGQLRDPLLFFRGGYGSFVPATLVMGEGAMVENLRVVDLARDEMASLAAEFATECTAIALVRDELVLIGSSGRAPEARVPTRVGQRVPFVPPVGTIFAAYGSPSLQAEWLGRLGRDAPAAMVERCREAMAGVRERGYAVGLGHAESSELEMVLELVAAGGQQDQESQALLIERIAGVRDLWNPASIEPDRLYEFRHLAVPVMDPDGRVCLELTLWGSHEARSGRDIDRMARRVIAAARSVTDRMTASRAGPVSPT